MKSYRALDSSRIAPNRDAVHPFDLQWGVDTGGYLSPKEIVTGHEHDAFCYGYSAIAPSVFEQALRRWRETLPGDGAHAAAYTFVDIGSGKGRALLLASQLPFRKAIGVEFSAELAEIAERNVARWRKVARPRSPLRVFQQDALAFRWPRGPLLVYLYNPFHCDLVERMLARIEQWSYFRTKTGAKTGASSGSRGGARTADILYVNPICADVLSRRRTFSLLWTDRVDMSLADQAADPYGTTFDRVSCYRLRR
jgi:SAM-dependent methyltransferase